MAVVMVLALLTVAGLVGAATLGAGPRRGTLAPSGEAVAAAEAWMARGGHPGTATVRGNEVLVTIDPFPMPTTLLSVVGIRQVTISAHASARAVDQPVTP